MSVNSDGDNLKMLQDHLQAIIEVEFFTIPVYLTGVYSFTDRALAYTPDGGKTYPLYNLQQETLSAAVQEMYHLQLACNLANAFSVSPNIPTGLTLTAGQTLTVPHLQADSQPIKFELGNLASLLAAMIEIEHHATGAFEEPNSAVVYSSIGNLYHATLQLLHLVGQTMQLAAAGANPGEFDPGNKQVAYGTFPSTYIYNTISADGQQNPDGSGWLSPTDLAKKLANAVTDQGEGHVIAQALRAMYARAAQPSTDATASDEPQPPALLSAYTFGADDSVNEEFQPAAGSRFAAYGAITHHGRFQDVQTQLNSQDWAKTIGGPVFYPYADSQADLPAWAQGKTSAQLNDWMNTVWSYLIDTMQTGFSQGKLPEDRIQADQPSFTEAMLAFKYLIPVIWQSGACPSFAYTPSDPSKVQYLMDQMDPLCLFHFDLNTANLRFKHPDRVNACQGLNACAGLGWGGIATEKGNGACATASLHTCGGNNTCGYQGGCGYLVSRSGEACGSSKVAAAATATTGGADAAAEAQASAHPRVENLCGPPPPPDKDLLLPHYELWIPGENRCGRQGGCQTPISPKQVFNTEAGAQIDEQPAPSYQNPGTGWTPEAKDRLKRLMGKNVWDHARELFALREGYPDKDYLPDPLARKEEITYPDGSTLTLDYDGTKRRAAIQPTSK